MRPQTPSFAVQQEKPFNISTSPSKGLLSIDRAASARINKEINIDAEMRHSFSNFGS